MRQALNITVRKALEHHDTREVLSLRYSPGCQIKLECQYLEDTFRNNCTVNKPDTVRHLLNWFFLDRRYRYLKIISSNTESEGRIKVYKRQKGRYLVLVDKWPKNSNKEFWVHENTSSEKEVLHLCRDFVDEKIIGFEVS